MEFLLTKTREIKAQKDAYDQQEETRRQEIASRGAKELQRSLQSFVESLDGVASVVKRKASDISGGGGSTSALSGGDETTSERRRKIDDR